jgi:hypothetical protein
MNALKDLWWQEYLSKISLVSIFSAHSYREVQKFASYLHYVFLSVRCLHVTILKLLTELS